MAKDSLRIRVGEQVFYTSRATIANGGRSTFLAAITDPLWQRPGSSEETVPEVFIDRNPAYFSVILDFLRTGELHIPGSMSETAFFREAQYYGVLEQVRAARRQPLNGDHMARTATVRVCPVRKERKSAINANADGGCCVTQGGVVRVYNWMLEQQAALNLDHAPVNDTEFMEGACNVNRLLIGTDKRTFTCKCPEKLEGAEAGGGLACFDTCSGELVHRYSVEAGERLWEDFRAAAVVTNGEQQVFAYCTLDDWKASPSWTHTDASEWMDGIGTWDGTTGQQIIFLPHEGATRSIDKTWGHKLQWLPHSSSLLVAYSSGYRSWVGLLDPRSNTLLSLLELEEGTPSGRCDCPEKKPKRVRGVNQVNPFRAVVDVAAMEDCVSVWLADVWRGMGFLDIRYGGGMETVMWHSDGNYGHDFSCGKRADETCRGRCSRCLCVCERPSTTRKWEEFRTRLACWGCHLFATHRDKVYVFSSPTRTERSGGSTTKNRARPGLMFNTASVRGQEGVGNVVDVSVGGDRLFVLHNDEDNDVDVFEVWETPNTLTKNYLHGIYV